MADESLSTRTRNKMKANSFSIIPTIIAAVSISSAQVQTASYAESPGAEAVVIYLSPNGDDTSDGSKRAPLATIAAACRKVRQLKAPGSLPQGGVVVEMLGGRYHLAGPIELTADDSGTAAAPIVYRACPGEEVTICGSRSVERWQPVHRPRRA